MSESFEKFKQDVSAPEAFSNDDMLDTAAWEKLGGAVLTKADTKFDADSIERSRSGLTNTYTYSPEKLDALHRQLFALKQYDFLYENKRIKSVEVLCRQLREVLTKAGMSERDIHALFSGELSPVINKLAAYEEVPVPKAEQAQEEMSLRSRLLSTATARFFTATKLKPAEVMTVRNEPELAVVAPPVEVLSVPNTAMIQPKGTISNQVYEAMEDQEKLATSDYEARAEFLAANDIRSALLRQQNAVSETSASGDNGVATAREAGTIDASSMSSESPKIAVPAEVQDTPAASEASSAEGAEERSVASLMAQADRLIALTKKRRERNDLTHKEAKLDSDDYAAARSEITKIKNRLRAILEERDVEQKRAEIATLRSSLAGHLWALRKDFPITKEEGATDTDVQGTDEDVAVVSPEQTEFVEPNLDDLLPEPDYKVMAREAGADVSPQQSVEAAVKAAREKLDEKIAETASYRNSILAGTEGDRIMSVKQKLQTLETRLASAMASPNVMRPEEVQAFRSQLADVEYALNQMEATAPKKLLGLPVPRAADGPFAVRAFRDALNLEWQPFKRAAEKSTDADTLQKKQAFESIFKILGYIPESGLTEAEATELRRLAESIALPARISRDFTPTKQETVPEAEVKSEVMAPLVLSELMRVREGAAARVLKEKLPGVAQKEIDQKRDTKARRWFAGFGALAIGGVLLGLFGGDDADKKSVTSGKSPLETAAPAAPSDVLEPIITIKPEVKPIEGKWPSGDAATESPSTNDSVPTITDITDRVAAEGERAPDYTVMASDNLWDFAEGDVEDREPLAPLQGLTELQKSLVLNDMITALKYSPERMRDLGLRSGNPNLIFPGEVIKTQVLVDLLNEIKRDRNLA